MCIICHFMFYLESSLDYSVAVDLFALLIYKYRDTL